MDLIVRCRLVTRILLLAIAWTVAVVAAIALVFAGSTETHLTGSGFSPGFVGLALAVATDASVGAVLALRRPGNVVGLVLVLAANLLGATFLGFLGGALLTEQRGSHDVIAGLTALIGVLGIYPTLIVAGPLVALVFPDGRLPAARWRWPVAAIVVAVAVGSLTTLMRPGRFGASLAYNPLGMNGFSGSEWFWTVGETLAAAALPFALLVALAAVVVRLRRSQAVERAQIKWFVAANVVVGVLLTLSIVDGGASPTIFDVLAPWSLSLPPIAVGIAIMRYRLYEIDRIISRTLGWALVTSLLAAIFAGLVVGLQALSTKITGGNTLAVAASTLVVAALFQPLRRRVQAGVDQRFNRARYDAQHTTDTFAEHVRSELDLGQLRSALIDTAGEAVSPVTATVWLRGASR